MDSAKSLFSKSEFLALGILVCSTPMAIFPRFGFTLTLHSEEKKSISEITSLVNCGVMGDKKVGCTLPCYDYKPFLFNFSTPSISSSHPCLLAPCPLFTRMR